MISIARDHSRKVEHWQAGRWRCAGAPPGSPKPANSSRRVNGHVPLPALPKVLDEQVAAQTVGAVRQDENVIAA
jgi:hypothetical protein